MLLITLFLVNFIRLVIYYICILLYLLHYIFYFITVFIIFIFYVCIQTKPCTVGLNSNEKRFLIHWNRSSIWIEDSARRNFATDQQTKQLLCRFSRFHQRIRTLRICIVWQQTESQRAVIENMSAATALIPFVEPPTKRRDMAHGISW